MNFQCNICCLLIFLLLFETEICGKLFSQCNPPASETCEGTSVFCSLDELNGFSCNNPSTTVVSYDCKGLCAFGPGPTFRTWWAFVSQGGNTAITFNVGACTNCPCSFGLVFGIWGDCQCTEQVACIPGCIATGKSITYQVNLKSCKTYYISVDGCCDCICDFTINTSGGGPPLSLDNINDVPSGIIQPVCVGACDYEFTVNAKNNCLPPFYQWELDGIDVGDNSNSIKLDFPNAGDFVLCVSAYVRDPMSGPSCQAGPKCATIKVRPIADKPGKARTVCWELANPNGLPWHSQRIFTSGKYKEQFSDTKCCKYDSVVDFTILPQIVPKEVYYISCDTTPFIDQLGRRHLPCKNHFEISLPGTTDLYKCDSTIILTAISVDYSPQWQAKCIGNKVELAPNISILNNCNIGESYKFDYKWYKKNDTAKVTISTNERLLVDTVNEDYCLDVYLKVYLGADSTLCIKTFCDSINEADSKSSIKNLDLFYCDSAIINGTMYTQSTQFTQQLKNRFGCDSIINTEIRIQRSSQTDISQSACDSIILNKQLYTATGIYKQILTNANGCDSILNLDITIERSSQTDISQTDCDSVVINNIIYKQSGMYKQIFQTIGGCDSILNLDITIERSSQTDISQTDCDSVVINGKVYTQSGDYKEVYQSANGCDSTLVIHVNIPSSNVSPLVLSKCDSVTINKIHYTQSGSYIQLLTSANGCDSTLNIDLTIQLSRQADISQTACDSFVLNNFIYKQSGAYQQKLQTAGGCDSTLNIDLNITKSTSGDTLFRSCDSVKINGITYNQTGIYQQTLTNSNQCDSTLIIDFTRLSKSTTSVNYKSCDSIVVNNQVYKQSGKSTQILVNANQCDSVLNLDITIGSSSQTVNSQTACDSVVVNGKIYKQSGIYKQMFTSSEGCDSILNLDIRIQKSSQAEISQTDCDAIVVNSQSYSQTGDYTQLLKNANLCDSFLTIHFTRLNSSSADLAFTSCDSTLVNGKTYYQSGNYSQLLINSNGCDSTLRLDLIIKPGNPTTLDAGKDTSICDGEIIRLNGIFSGPANFSWQSSTGSFDNPNNLNTNYYPDQIGNERIYLKAEDDCKQWLDSLAILVYPKQIVQITGDTILNPCDDKEISFIASGGTNYIWTPSSHIECLDPACRSVRLNSKQPIKFTITTDGPCAIPANLNLSLAQTQSDIYLPNAFSPNGDNINDFFMPIFNCDAVTFFNLQIFDRWGNILFESQNKDKGWNGKYQDVNLNPGVYPFVIEYELHGAGKKVKAGEITLVR